MATKRVAASPTWFTDLDSYAFFCFFLRSARKTPRFLLLDELLLLLNGLGLRLELIGLHRTVVR